VTNKPISADLDLGDLDETTLAFAEAMATELRYQAPALFAALAKTLEHERDRRRRGDTPPVLFVMSGDSLADTYEAARAALAHATLCNAHAIAAVQLEPQFVVGWRALSKLFLALHSAIVDTRVGDLLAYRAFTLSPPTAA